MPYYSKPKSNKPARWFYAILAILALAVLYWAYVMHPVAAEVIASPRTLPPDGKSRAEIRIALLNRIETEVPGSSATLVCEVIEGRELVQVRYNADKTMAYVVAGDMEGVVEVKVSSPELVIPHTIMIYIETPRA